MDTLTRFSEDKPPFQKTYHAKKVVLCVWSSVQRKRPFFPDFHAPVTAKGCQNKLPAFPGLLPAQVIRAASQHGPVCDAQAHGLHGTLYGQHAGFLPKAKAGKEK